MLECDSLKWLGQIGGNHVIRHQSTTHATKSAIKLVNQKFWVTPDEDASCSKVLKDVKADDKGFIFGLIIRTIEIQLQRKIPVVVIWDWMTMLTSAEAEVLEPTKYIV